MSLASSSVAAEHDPRSQVLRGSTGLPLGGMGSIVRAMRHSFEAPGGEVRPYPKTMRGGSGSTVDDFCAMAEWTAERFGIDAVGFGSDYHAGHSPDAITWWRAGRWARSSPVQGTLARWPDYFDTPARCPGVIDALRRRGFTGDDVRKVAGGNWLRLFRESFGPMPAWRDGHRPVRPPA